jgi:recombination protein RecA
LASLFNLVGEMKKKTRKELQASLSLFALMQDEIKKSKKEIDILSLGDDSTPLVVKDVLSTGLPNLDKILSRSADGRWGLPVGKIVSLKSKPSVGKTTFLLRVAEEALRRGGAAHIIESEHALDLKYARKICPSVDSFFITQPDTLEDAFDAAKNALEICLKARTKDNNAPFVIVFDSFSGFSPAAELDGDFSTSGKAMGQHARLASMACRKLTGMVAKANAIMLLSHQTKSKIGVFWGSTETNIGGAAFDFHDSICLNLYRTTAIKDDKKRIAGHYGIIKTTKNKLYPPHREVKFKMVNGKGFSKAFAILDYLIENRIVLKKGGWFHFKEDSSLKWQGADGFNTFLKGSKKARSIAREAIK